MLLSELTSFVDANRCNGRTEAFGINNTKNYLRWAFLHDYLFVSYDDGEISGVGVAYPIQGSYNGDESILYPSNSIATNDEQHRELCVMDICALSPSGRVGLVSKFKRRYPNWENQKKWAIRFDNVVEISNNYINLTEVL